MMVMVQEEREERTSRRAEAKARYEARVAEEEAEEQRRREAEEAEARQVLTTTHPHTRPPSLLGRRGGREDTQTDRQTDCACCPRP